MKDRGALSLVEWDQGRDQRDASDGEGESQVTQEEELRTQ